MAEFGDSEMSVDDMSVEGPSVFDLDSSSENSRSFRHPSGKPASGKSGGKSPRGTKSPNTKRRKSPHCFEAEAAYREEAAEASDESSDVDDAVRVPSCSGKLPPGGNAGGKPRVAVIAGGNSSGNSCGGKPTGGSSAGGKGLKKPHRAGTKSIRRKHIVVTSNVSSDDDDEWSPSRQSRRHTVRSEEHVPPAQRTGGSRVRFAEVHDDNYYTCLLYTSPSPRDGLLSRMPSSA